ncbi:MAG TPA: hypothetical protein ENI76_08090 [Ignavibacteria bacterium]|nr:hypothetical protein [Ignavibacteria bacterium]
MSAVNTNYLPSDTKRIFEVLCKTPFIKSFVLVGGTALSLQIGHRLSEDLDFVYDGETLPVSNIKRNISKLFPRHKLIRQDNGYQLDFVIENTKLTFFSTGAVTVPFHVKDYSFPLENIQIATVEAIGVLKFGALSQRNTLRDYYDLYCITKDHILLLDLITKTKQLLSNISPITFTETLIYTKDIPENTLGEHLQPKYKVTKEEITDYFIAELQKIVDKI